MSYLLDLGFTGNQVFITLHWLTYSSILENERTCNIIWSCATSRLNSVWLSLFDCHWIFDKLFVRILLRQVPPPPHWHVTTVIIMIFVCGILLPLTVINVWYLKYTDLSLNTHASWSAVIDHPLIDISEVVVYRLGTVHNCQCLTECIKHTFIKSFGGGVNGKKHWFRTLSTFYPIFYHFRSKLSIWKMLMCAFLEGEGVWESIFCTFN